MRNKSWKALSISLFIIIVIGLLCVNTNAQWPAAIADPYATIFSGFGISPVLGGTFGVTSLYGLSPGSYLYPSYSYYDPFDFDDYWYWQPYTYDPWDLDDLYLYSAWNWSEPYFGVTSSFFPIYTAPPWWASALAFL